MHYIKKSLSLLVTVALLTTACSDFLEEESIGTLSSAGFPASADEALAAVNGVYSSLSPTYRGRNYIMLSELPTEALTTRRNNEDNIAQLDNYTWTETYNATAGMYEDHYAIIKDANFLLDNIDRWEASEAEQGLKDRIIGEASFLRAFAYFQLYIFFGEVPLREQFPTADDDFEIPAAETADIFNLIISDLTEAVEGLSNWQEYTSDSDLGRASRGAALGLLAKAYLTKAQTEAAEPSDFTNAQAATQRVIDEENYELVDLQQLYGLSEKITQKTANFVENIFVFQRDASLTGGQASQHSNWAPRRSEPDFGTVWSNFNAELPFFQSYEEEDARRETFFILEYESREVGGQVTFNADSLVDDGYWNDGPAVSKYVDPTAKNNGQDNANTVFLRYADVLLMQAEALNEINQGPTPEAYEAINQVRARSRNTPEALPDLAGLSYQDFKEALYDERRKEFVAEGLGLSDRFRFWDIARQRIEASSRRVYETANNCAVPDVEINATDFYRFFPVPPNITDVNPALGGE